jgi:geranylgeranyl diphosphate synthase, type II
VLYLKFRYNRHYLHEWNLLMSSLIKSYQLQIIQGIQKDIESLGPKTKLRDACEYALMNGGKRLRPALVFMVANALGHSGDVMPAALSIEYFHTASLVADDLPCMDDDDERRNKPSVHKKYGETLAMLVSYALIAAGYGCLAQNAQLLRRAGLPYSAKSDHLCVLALENATYNTGLMGATGGQFLDIFPPDLTVAALREIIHKKTVSLFEISFVSGWLFGGGEPSLLPTVKEAASHFGTAFQIADDLEDMAQDAINQCKVNFACCFGKEEAIKTVQQEISLYVQAIEKLKLSHTDLANLVDLIKKTP